MSNLNKLWAVFLLLADHIVQPLAHVDIGERLLGLRPGIVFVVLDEVDLLVMAFLQLLDPLLEHEDLGLELLVLIHHLVVLSIPVGYLGTQKSNLLFEVEAIVLLHVVFLFENEEVLTLLVTEV